MISLLYYEAYLGMVENSGINTFHQGISIIWKEKSSARISTSDTEIISFEDNHYAKST